MVLSCDLKLGSITHRAMGSAGASMAMPVLFWPFCLQAAADWRLLLHTVEFLLHLSLTGCDGRNQLRLLPPAPCTVHLWPPASSQRSSHPLYTCTSLQLLPARHCVLWLDICFMCQLWSCYCVSSYIGSLEALLVGMAVASGRDLPCTLQFPAQASHADG